MQFLTLCALVVVYSILGLLAAVLIVGAIHFFTSRHGS
jgi:hypothetical protein